MRNSKLFKFAMMSIMLCSVSAAFASSASAWTTSTGGLSLAATAPASKLSIATASPVIVQCTGTAAGDSVPGTGSLINMTNSPGSPKQLSNSAGSVLRLSFTGCTAAGLAASVNCTGTVPTLWGNSYSTAVWPQGETSGEVRNVTCSITVSAFPGCKITVTSTGPNGRAVLGAYRNPPAQTLTISNVSQTLTASWVNCPFISPPTGSASATFTNLANGPLVYTSTAAVKPIITNP